MAKQKATQGIFRKRRGLLIGGAVGIAAIRVALAFMAMPPSTPVRSPMHRS